MVPREASAMKPRIVVYTQYAHKAEETAEAEAFDESAHIKSGSPRKGECYPERPYKNILRTPTSLTPLRPANKLRPLSHTGSGSSQVLRPLTSVGNGHGIQLSRLRELHSVFCCVTGRITLLF
jgi:hypothetical protein